MKNIRFHRELDSKYYVVDEIGSFPRGLEMHGNDIWKAIKLKKTNV